MEKKGEFKREMMFGRSAEIQIVNAFNGMVEMDFVDYGIMRLFYTFGIPFRDSQ